MTAPAAAKKADTLKVKTPEAILSYPYFFKPQPGMNGGKDKYSGAFVFTVEAQESPLYKNMQRAALEAARAKWGEKADAMIRGGKLRMPFRKSEDDDVEKGYPVGSVYVNARADQRPGVVDRYNDPDTGRPRVITEEKEVYPGMIVQATMRAFAYDHSGNKGVAFGLNNVQKIRDGERLDGRKRADEDFDGEDMSNAPDDLDDLMG